MRITGGEYRGRIVKCPQGPIRPTMDRMRVSLFSILGDLTEVSFLDLFSGSGIMGIEAASRGAEPVVLVEKDARKRAVIASNISFVKTPIRIVTAPVERFLARDSELFDLVFLDPPFDFSGKGPLLDEAGTVGRHLSPGGLVLIHLHRAEKLETGRRCLELADRREYGQSLLLFFRPRDGAPPVEASAPGDRVPPLEAPGPREPG